ncbi:MAG: peptide ABC transporter ATP-binding protein [Deltaproteobacteria bacterium]|nr:MAG: peptide ABC transporter ATP-binding protein [Deltaproteobacteria bacterium]
MPNILSSATPVSPLLSVSDLTVSFETESRQRVPVVDRISFSMNPGESLGLVGESGSGKSVTALSLMRLLPIPEGRIEGGEVIFRGESLLQKPVVEMRRIRGRHLSMVFQDPLSALSPLKRVGDQLREAIFFQQGLKGRAAYELAVDWLSRVRIPDPVERMKAFPYALSGGMQQRVMIAMALLGNPELIIADEPTTALDVTTQAQVFALLRRMRKRQSALLLITHDMGVVWEMCERVLVMYAGVIVEDAPVDALFASPAHPYTQGLLASIPRLGCGKQRLSAIPGQVPGPEARTEGCRFRDRCSEAMPCCRLRSPEMTTLAAGHRVACFLHGPAVDSASGKERGQG